MAVKEEHKADSIQVLFTDGDKEKLERVLNDWKFKDIQSLTRFLVSALLITKDHELWIKEVDGILEQIRPPSHLLKSKHDNVLESAHGE